MSAATQPTETIDQAHLQDALSAVDPAALLLPRRILRRVIKRHRGLGGLGLGVPHRKSFVLARETLLSLATAEELEIAHPEKLPHTLCLLQQPYALELAHLPAGQALRDTWRLLFHLHLHLRLDGLREGGTLTPEKVHAGIQRLGAGVFAEAHEVLRQENFLFEGDGLVTVWEEFATVFLELYHFEPRRIAQFFPAIEDPKRVYDSLTEEIDAAKVFHETRLAGADLPGEHGEDRVGEESTKVIDRDITSTAPGVLRLRAEQVARKGNLVRAALTRFRAIDRLPASQAGVLRAEARHDIKAFVDRLQAALRFAPAEKSEWVDCLVALAEPASVAVWSPGSRLLYDLQKVCIDVERPAFAADLVEWVVSWFQRPIKRPLPDLPLVLAVKHLRQARSRLPVVPLDAEHRRRLDELTAAALESAEERLRHELRPKLLAGLDAVGLVPENAAERFSRNKLVEELLDLVSERGYLTIGDLRDALARNQLKLPDLAGPITFFAGDPLIRLNRDLAARLDGIYRRGEIYLRWLQRLSSLFFATVVGRLLTLYLILPLLGAFFILKFIDEMSELAHKFFGAPKIETLPLDKEGFQPLHLWTFGLLAVFLLLVLHAPPFRRGVLRLLWYAWVAVRFPLFDLPGLVLQAPFIRHILQNRVYLAFYQFVGKPVAWTLPVGIVLWVCGVGALPIAGVCAVLALVISLVLNSRLGMLVEETATDWFLQSWRHLRDDLVPGVFRSIVWLSHWLLERVDKMLYTVDEWLRFRQGDSAIAFVVKVILSLIWFFVTYIVRLVVNVFFEPQVNPLKHFPIVTVSHKLMFILAQPTAEFVAGWLAISTERALGMVVVVFALIPGMFGFLAWELKANWRLYRANRSPTLDPEVVGGHGERVINYLRPGFHSGTLPKLFARMRGARGSRERKREADLHHAEGDLLRFVERDLIAVVQASKAWTVSATMVVGRVHPATNRIRFELCCPGIHPESAWVELSFCEGWLLGGITEKGFLAHLEPGPRLAFEHALAGFYKWCGIDFLSERLETLAPEGGYELTRDRLILLGCARRVDYDLASLPASADGLLFSHEPITWDAWVGCWAADEIGAGAATRAPGLPEVDSLAPQEISHR
jgi:hypothetical protein